MFLYHGSNIVVNKPQLVKQTRGLDFGHGFYLTTNENQAKRFSEIVYRRRKTGSQAVSVYKFDIEKAEKTLRIRKFKNADADWLRFVVENRLNIYNGDVYDMVIGAVANDTLMPTIQAYQSGFISEEAAIITLKTSKLFDQICLKTETALSLLDFINAYEVECKED